MFTKFFTLCILLQPKWHFSLSQRKTPFHFVASRREFLNFLSNGFQHRIAWSFLGSDRTEQTGNRKIRSPKVSFAAGWLPLEFRFYLSSDCAVFNEAETKHKRGEDYSSKKSNNRYLNQDCKCYLAAGRVSYLVPFRKRVIPYSEMVKQVQVSCQQLITKQ